MIINLKYAIYSHNVKLYVNFNIKIFVCVALKRKILCALPRKVITLVMQKCACMIYFLIIIICNHDISTITTCGGFYLLYSRQANE